ncbi:uncharacterized protein [Taeniopygia guttata]|uniref:uncharacterized protein n=1 Tax=Taeniopygia guttata TaxID=59729 RepID=UPI003BB910E1
MRIPPPHVPVSHVPAAAVPAPRGRGTGGAGRRTRDSRGHAPAAASLPPPPARPSRIHGRIQRPGPRRAASPRGQRRLRQPRSPRAAAFPHPPLHTPFLLLPHHFHPDRFVSSPSRVCVFPLPNPLAPAYSLHLPSPQSSRARSLPRSSRSLLGRSLLGLGRGGHFELPNSFAAAAAAGRGRGGDAGPEVNPARGAGSARRLRPPACGGGRGEAVAGTGPGGKRRGWSRFTACSELEGIHKDPRLQLLSKCPVWGCTHYLGVTSFMF